MFMPNSVAQVHTLPQQRGRTGGPKRLDNQSALNIVKRANEPLYVLNGKQRGRYDGVGVRERTANTVDPINSSRIQRARG